MIEKIVYLSQGKIKPDFYGIELGMSDKLVIRALEKTTSMSSNEIQEQSKKYRKEIVEIEEEQDK